MSENQILFIVIGGALALSIVIALIWMRSVRKRHRSVTSVDRYEKGRIHYTCPKCGGPMNEGYVIFGYGLHFLPDLKRVWRHAFDIEGGLPNTVNFSLGTAGNPAWRCPSCMVLIVDHSCLVARRQTKRSSISI